MTLNRRCLLLVSSKLVQASPINLSDAVDVARKFKIPTVIDGAAQDFRIGELLDTGADIILTSAQKYLASPTAGCGCMRRFILLTNGFSKKVENHAHV